MTGSKKWLKDRDLTDLHEYRTLDSKTRNAEDRNEVRRLPLEEIKKQLAERRKELRNRRSKDWLAWVKKRTGKQHEGLVQNGQEDWAGLWENTPPDRPLPQHH